MALLNEQPVQPINGVVTGTDAADVIIAEAADSGITLDGGPGVDTQQSSGTNNTLLGGLGDDSLESLSGADNTTMVGGPGNDFMVGLGTNDTASYANDPASVVVDLSTFSAIDGAGGIDTLVGIENVSGSAFADSLTGDALANVLQGGAGDDTMTGNGAEDVFRFSFDLEQGSGGGSAPLSFGDWLTTEHALNIGNLHQNEFVQNYKEWLGYLAEELRENHGFDTIPENARVSFKQNDSGSTPTIEGLSQAELGEIFGDVTAISVKTGKTSQERYYSDIDTNSGLWGGSSEDTLTSGDGFDTIVDFVWGTDQLEFDGLADLSLDQFAGFFDVTQEDVNGDGTTDTVLALADDTWEVTLLDVSGHTVDEFYGSSIFS